jgi:serine/threonine-protein kinase
MTRIAGRYEVKAKLGEGGMGVVFRAYDPPPMDREVAVKTLHEFEDPLALELFYKECTALKSISHPNIVEIFDMGESEAGGTGRPFFVMPLLPGQTLDELIRKASHRLTVERVVEIFMQTCRGLQAAHERGLIHRDLKPSNIFVMADDSVKLIDFGVAHAVHARTRTTGFDKGTLLYMAPEQVQRQPVSVQSDVYALGVTLYEALTRRQPFRNATEESVIQAILKHIPPPASDLNPAVSHVISRVVHKAMAKQPWNRFDSARELGETLQKAYRNEPIAIFDPARTQPRIQTATKALEKGDFQFAGEIVSELEAEGNIDPQIALLRAQIDQIARQKTVAQLLESARARYEEQEDPLALQKIQEILQLDPTNVGALGLKSKIEDRRSERQIEQWVQLAQQHVSNKSYGHAREALQNALMLRPKDARAARLLKEVETDEQEYMRLRREKTELYQAAVNAWQNGEVSQALSQMKLVLELDQRAPDASSPDAAGTYQSFYNKIRSEHDAMNNGYAEARRLLADQQYGKALEICRTFLEKYPGQALFQALKFDVEEQQRQRLSAFIADVDRRLEAEPDLDARVHLIREAVAEFPEEDHFRRVAKTLEDKRDLVNSIVERAKLHESSHKFTEALNDLETLRTIYSGYPGLSFEKERLQKRLEQQARDAARAKWSRQIDAQLQTGDYPRALELLDQAEVEFPADAELAELRKLAHQGIDRARRADELVAEGQQLCEQGQFDQGIDLLKIALQLEDRTSVRMTLRDQLIGRAQEVFENDWQAADALVEDALELDPNHALAKSLRARALDKRRDQEVGLLASQARRLQAEGQIDAAMAEVEKGLATYPSDTRLNVIKDALKKELSRVQPPPEVTTRVPPPTRGTSPTRGGGDAPAQSLSGAEALERTRIVPDRREPTSPGGPGSIPPPTPPPPDADGPKDDWEKTQIAPRKGTAAEPAAGTTIRARTPIPPQKLWIGVAAAVVLLLGAYFFWPTGEPGPPPDSTVLVRGQAGTNIFADGTHIGEIRPDGTFEFALATGPHELRFDLSGFLPATATVNAADGKPIEVTVGHLEPIPPTMGTVKLLGVRPGSRVLIDKQDAGFVGEDGSFETKAPPGDREVGILANGYEPYTVTINLTAEQPVEISDVELTPLRGNKPPPPPPPPPAAAALLVEGMPPDTLVSIDGKPVGTVGPDGRLRFAQVEPGPHTVKFTKDGYHEGSVDRTFKAGETFVYSTPITPSVGKVHFRAERGVRVQLFRGGRKPGMKPDRTFTGEARQDLPPGDYEVVSVGPAQYEFVERLAVKAGLSPEYDVRIADGIERLNLSVPAQGGDDVQELEAWTRTGAWFARSKPGFVLLDRENVDGTVQFSVSLTGLGDRQLKRVRWVVGFKDARTRILFDLGRDGLLVSDAARPTPVKAAALPDHKGSLYLNMYITPTQVTVRYQNAATGTWVPFHTWNAPAGSRAAIGRVGFLIEPNETLLISNFRRQPIPR